MRFAAICATLTICLMPAVPVRAQPRPPGGASGATSAGIPNAAAAPGATATPTGRPWPRIATRQLAFTIPYQVSVSPASQRPAEVRLFVSSDGGKTWELHSRQPADATKFPFQASADGSYLFLVRTVDAAGQLHPPGPARPELEVVVDTQLPEMSLEATVGPAGELRAQWKLSDPHLAAETFSLQYQSGPDAPWQTVAVQSPRPGTTPGEQSGSTMWWSRGLAETVTIRAEVRDWAGNSTVRQCTVEVPRIAGQLDGNGTSSEGNGVVPPDRTAMRPISDGSASYPKTPFQEIQPPPATAAKPAAAAPPTATAGARTAPAGPAGSAAAEPVLPQPGLTGPAPPGRNTTVWQGDPSPTVAGAEDPTAAGVSMPARNAGLGGSLADPRRYPPQTAAPQPAVARQADSFAAATAAPPTGQPSSGSPDSGGLPPGERPTMTASHRFQLEYNVEAIGPSGVRRVELWQTRDAGRTWTPVAVDDDNRSPLIVEPKEEGIYGYRIVVESGNGLTGQPPRPGDLAEIWVGVDWTKPTARITSAIYGSESRAGELEIHWEAEDTRLADRPISLLFAASPAGPWSPIASGLPNSGVYHWAVDNRVPSSIYLRLEVRDAAGNVAVHELQRPIANDGLVPQGRILRIQPTPEEARRGLTGWPAWR